MRNRNIDTIIALFDLAFGLLLLGMALADIGLRLPSVRTAVLMAFAITAIFTGGILLTTILQRARRVEAALARLVDAKDEKDAHGDTEVYRRLKTRAWDSARRALGRPV